MTCPRVNGASSTSSATVERHGYPPSVREIGEAVGLVSPSSVAYQLKALERKGYLRRDPNRPRAVDVRHPGTLAGSRAGAKPAGAAPAYVPMLGRIAAGGPILAEEMIEDVYPLPRELGGEGTLFLLQVKGDSMIEAAICDGDWSVRQQPDGTTATSRWSTERRSRRTGDGRPHLAVPQNPAYEFQATRPPSSAVVAVLRRV